VFKITTRTSRGASLCLDEFNDSDDVEAIDGGSLWESLLKPRLPSFERSQLREGGQGNLTPNILGDGQERIKRVRTDSRRPGGVGDDRGKERGMPHRISDLRQQKKKMSSGLSVRFNNRVKPV